MVDAAVGIVGIVGIKRSWGSSFSSAQTIENKETTNKPPATASPTGKIKRKIKRQTNKPPVNITIEHPIASGLRGVMRPAHDH
jgi:hypothetical protein